MNLDHLSCYRAMLARDRRFDGLFFTCVTSTGIYCRPICPARPPKLENCIFVATASAAQEAGFRACLRCRPDASPESPAWRGTSTTVARALRLISDGALDKGSVEKLALRLGVGERHLRRLFADHLGASPLTVAMTRRVLLAKQLVHDSDLGMTDIALASETLQRSLPQAVWPTAERSSSSRRTWDRRPSRTDGATALSRTL